ncbi:PDZ domain-containing protein [Planctomycetaceae bacterium SH139]
MKNGMAGKRVMDFSVTSRKLVVATCWCGLLWLNSWGGVVIGTTTVVAAEDNSPAPSQADLERYIDQLSAPSYHSRQVAMRRLESAGEAAIEPLEAAVRSGNLEVVDRASFILQSLAVLETPYDPPLAWNALGRLRQNGPGSAATRADSSIEMIEQDRSVRAQARLAAAGLKVGIQELTFNSRLAAEDAIIFPENWQIDSEALRWLPWMYSTTMVVMAGETVCDETIAAIVKLPKLVDIQLRDAKLSAAGLKKLAELERINTLELLFVDVGGPDEDLFAMAELPLRNTLVLTATKFVPEDVDALEGNFEGLEIIYSRGGFLGVQCSQADLACVVRVVVPDSAADRAGVRPGDVILSLGEHPITRFADLQVAVRQHAPSEPMEVVVQRFGRQEKLKVELGRL